MRGAIATGEIWACRRDAKARRLTLVVSSPERNGDASGWRCRIALADIHPAEELAGRDSIEALALALARARRWLVELRAEGFELARDAEGREPFDLESGIE